MLERQIIMYISKRIITTFLSFSLIFSNTVFANEFMKSANKAVSEANERSESIVNSLVTNKIGQIIANSLSTMKQLDRHQQSANLYAQSMINLRQQLTQFLNNPQNEVSATESGITKAYNSYLNLYSEMIDLSWIPIQIDQDFSELPLVLSQSISTIENQCNSGISDNDFEIAIQSSKQLPKYEFDWEMMLTFSNDNSGFSGDYKSYNYLNESKEMKALFDATKSTAMVSSAFWAAKPLIIANEMLGGASFAMAQNTAATSTMGSFSASAAAIAPYAIAAVVVVAIVMDMSARAKLEKLSKQRAEAEIYKFNNLKNTVWLSNAFKKRCSDIIYLLKVVKEDLNFVAANLNNPNAIKEYYAGDFEHINEINNSYLKYMRAENIKKLKSLHEQSKCSTEYKMKNLDRNSIKPEDLPPCYITSDYKEIRLTGQSISLPFNGGDPKIDTSKLKKDIEKFNTSDQSSESQERVLRNLSDYLRYQIYEMFVLRRAEVMSALKDYMGDYLIQTRKQAFKRLLSLIGVYTQSASSEVSERLRAEHDVFKTYLSFDERFKSLVASAIYHSYGKIDFKNFKVEATEYRQEFVIFYDEYNYVPDVRALMDKLQSLESVTGLKF